MVTLQRYFLWNISHALQFKTSMLFVVILLIPELLMHRVPSPTDDFFRMLAKIKAFPQLGDFQDKPWSNRANYFVCFHWETSKLETISPAHLWNIQAPAGVVALTVSCAPVPRAQRAHMYWFEVKPTHSSSRKFLNLWLKKNGMMKWLLISQNLKFKYVVRARVELLGSNTVTKQNNVFEIK